MKFIIKALMGIIYLPYLFLAKTWLGGIVVIVFTLSLPALIFGLFIDMNRADESSQAIGQFIGLLCFLLSPISAIPVIIIGGILGRYYKME